MAVDLKVEEEALHWGLEKQVSTPNWRGEHLELGPLKGRCPRRKACLVRFMLGDNVCKVWPSKKDLAAEDARGPAKMVEKGQCSKQ